MFTILYVGEKERKKETWKKNERRNQRENFDTF